MISEEARPSSVGDIRGGRVGRSNHRQHGSVESPRINTDGLLTPGQPQDLSSVSVFAGREFRQRALEGLTAGDESLAGAPLDPHRLEVATYRVGAWRSDKSVSDGLARAIAQAATRDETSYRPARPIRGDRASPARRRSAARAATWQSDGAGVGRGSRRPRRTPRAPRRSLRGRSEHLSPYGLSAAASERPKGAYENAERGEGRADEEHDLRDGYDVRDPPLRPTASRWPRATRCSRSHRRPRPPRAAVEPTEASGRGPAVRALARSAVA